jgi:formylglycine-generating enzyme required for sulfatase activity
MPGIEASLVPIAGAWLAMGSEDGADDERPIHRIWVDAFALGAWQVTNAEYSLFLQSTGQPPPPYWNDPGFNDPEQPVVAVSWFDAVSYCEWISSVTGRRFRLPTEAEWECAARGGTEGSVYPWGDDPPQSRQEYHQLWTSGPEPVARRAPNGYGLYDICENVHEWCSDWYEADYYSISPERNPHGPEGGTRRVSRGGSWRHRIKISRCAARSSIPPAFRYADYGLRVACEP